jgi:hypothetical protein
MATHGSTTTRERVESSRAVPGDENGTNRSAIFGEIEKRFSELAERSSAPSAAPKSRRMGCATSRNAGPSVASPEDIKVAEPVPETTDTAPTAVVEPAAEAATEAEAAAPAEAPTDLKNSIVEIGSSMINALVHAFTPRGLPDADTAPGAEPGTTADTSETAPEAPVEAPAEEAPVNAPAEEAAPAADLAAKPAAAPAAEGEAAAPAAAEVVQNL